VWARFASRRTICVVVCQTENIEAAVKKVVNELVTHLKASRTRGWLLIGADTLRSLSADIVASALKMNYARVYFLIRR